MANKVDLLYHARTIHDCLPRFRVRANMNLINFRLTLTGRNRYYEFFPLFVAYSDGGLQYTPALREQVQGFAGWLPYFNKRWPLATEKLPFKAFCGANGLPTPRYWTEPDDAARDVIIKQNVSSFGKGIRGPFKSLDGADPEQRLRDGEYYEQFIAGTIAKAWYWDDKLVSLEMFPMPAVTGDGERSLYDLIFAATPGRDARKHLDRSAFIALAAYNELSLDDVVPAGKRVVADFRYISPLSPRSAENSNVLAAGETALTQQFSAAGPVLWRAIPEDRRKATLWTLDAIVEEDAGRAWFLEMNCNPMVHPDAYFPMLEGLFGPADAAVVPASHPNAPAVAERRTSPSGLHPTQTPPGNGRKDRPTA